jgi:hypothetical protein
MPPIPVKETDAMIEDTNSCKAQNRHKINCDQVAWLLDIFNRYLPRDGHPQISREREMLMYGMLYEVMEIAHLCFEDDRARHNGTPNDTRT